MITFLHERMCYNNTSSIFIIEIDRLSHILAKQYTKNEQYRLFIFVKIRYENNTIWNVIFSCSVYIDNDLISYLLGYSMP